MSLPFGRPPELPEGTLLVVGQPPSDLDVIAVTPDAAALNVDPLTVRES